MNNINEIIRILMDAHEKADRLANNDPELDKILTKIYHLIVDIEILEQDSEFI